jgi:cytochrome c biogenesis protein
MRTALILLFLLAVAAVPGSILPQRPLNATKTSDYIAAHGGWGRFLDRIGMFDVFGSPWFAAIYLLLFVSLVGCILPRIRQHAKSLLRKPLPAPQHLDRLPESGGYTATATPVAAAAAARAALGRRWRVEQRVEDSGAITLAAEKGYHRESGNLLFHVALLAALLLIGVGQFYKYEGSRIVVEGADQGFCNTVSQYDSWRPGRLAAQGKVHPAPFCLDELSKFTAIYSASGEPRKFAADVVYRPHVDAAPISRTITVNNPLRLEGDRVYLIGHGFAPQLTIRMPDGTVRHDTQAFMISDPSTLYSEGAFKEQGKPGANQDVGISGFFAPTPAETTKNVITSISPEVTDPMLGIFVYTGDLNFNGVPQAVYTLDTSKLTKVGAANMRIGETRTFPGGVEVTFDGWKPWVNFQVSHDPAQGWLLLAAGAMVLGLLGSLSIRRRRIWLRFTPASATGGSSHTVVAAGGLARSDSGNFTAEFDALLRRQQGATEPAPAGPEPIAAGRE